MTPGLRGQLQAALAAAEATHSSYRPAVARYLFEAGLGRLWAALDAESALDEALLVAVWRLMLDTVATRRFGVSSDAWRDGDYPDRYFPVLWLDVVPAGLPRVPPADRLAWLTALFNVGDNLPAAVRPAANQLAACLSARVDALAADLAGTLRAALVEVGLVAPAVVPPAQWTRVEWLGGLDLSVVDDLVVGDVVWAGDRFIVRDVSGRPRVGLTVAGDGLAFAEPVDQRPTPSWVAIEGRACVGPGGPLGPARGVAPTIAVAESGDGVAADAASLWVWRVRASGA